MHTHTTIKKFEVGVIYLCFWKKLPVHMAISQIFSILNCSLFLPVTAKQSFQQLLLFSVTWSF